MNVDIAPLLAAVIDMEGGEYRIPFAELNSQTGEKVLALDIEDDGKTLVLRLVDAEDVILEDDNADGAVDA